MKKLTLGLVLAQKLKKINDKAIELSNDDSAKLVRELTTGTSDIASFTAKEIKATSIFDKIKERTTTIMGIASRVNAAANEKILSPVNKVEATAKYGSQTVKAVNQVDNAKTSFHAALGAVNVASVVYNDLKTKRAENKNEDKHDNHHVESPSFSPS